MTLSEKRMDAARTLVVPYDATPDAVDDAYERRLEQCFGLKNNMDLESFARGNDGLYDARVRMRMPEKMQWCASLRLFATTQVDKIMHITMVRFRQLRRDAKSKTCRALADELISDQKNMCRKYNIFRAVLGYEIAGIWSTIIYNHASQHPNPIVPIAVCGTMMGGVIAVGYLMDSIRKKTIEIGVKHFLLQELLPYDALFQNQK